MTGAERVHKNPITTLRYIFVCYLVLSFVLLVFTYKLAGEDIKTVSLVWIYPALFGLSCVSCLVYLKRPRIGASAEFLLPISLASAIRSIDLLWNAWSNWDAIDSAEFERRVIISSSFMFLCVSIYAINFFEDLVYSFLKLKEEQQND